MEGSNCLREGRVDPVVNESQHDRLANEAARIAAAMTNWNGKIPEIKPPSEADTLAASNEVWKPPTVQLMTSLAEWEAQEQLELTNLTSLYHRHPSDQACR